MLNVPITLPRTIEDTDGQDWDIQSNGPVGNGETDAFGGGFQWTAFNPAAGALLSEDGREINIDATSLTGAAGVAASRSIFVSETRGYARFLDSFTDTTGAQITFTDTPHINPGFVVGDHAAVTPLPRDPRIGGA